MSEAVTAPHERGLLEPPAELVALIGGSMEIGHTHVMDLQRLSRLVPRDRVLDVGSGVGRTALWLTSLLTKGNYEGFDVNRESIEWCQREITSRFPSFRFTHLDVHNAAYNPSGTIPAEELTFPYADQRFSLVCLFSVFTHLLAAGLERYLAESHRVLRPRGRIHATCFLLTRERSQLPAPDSDGIATAFEVAEVMVAYDEASLRERFRAAGFELRVVSYGNWADHGLGRAGEGTQDVIVAHRT